jgi:hypothetical protein
MSPHATTQRRNAKTRPFNIFLCGVASCVKSNPPSQKRSVGRPSEGMAERVCSAAMTLKFFG